MCQKTILGKPSRKVDSCLVDEINNLKTTEWNQKYKSIMSCCGHEKYPKTLIVQNRGSSAVFEWFSGTSLSGTKRKDSRAPYYKKDTEGYYFIPEISQEVT